MDVLGFGDADEISSRENALLLKSCEFIHSSVDAGTLYIEGLLRKRIRTDWPVKDHPNHIGDPSFFTLEQAIKNGNPSRTRGRSPAYIIGGAHLSNVLLLCKQRIMVICHFNLSNASPAQNAVSTLYYAYEGFHDPKTIDFFHQLLLDQKTLNSAEDLFSKSSITDLFRNYSLPQDDLPPKETFPWFLRCNPDRYPMWFGKHDLRLDYTKEQAGFDCDEFFAN